jgi:folate-binding protein YgfZ
MDETRDLGLLAEGAVLAGVGRELVAGTGADRLRFLHGLVTSDVAGLAAGRGTHAALLTVKAHVVSEMHIFVREADVLVAVPAGEGKAVADALARYAIMDDFAATPRTDLGMLAVLGPAAADHLAQVGLGSTVEALSGAPPWSHGEHRQPSGDLWMARARQLGADGFWIAASAPALAAVEDDLAGRGVARLAPDVAEAARVAAGEPAWGREITSDYFPMEVGLEDAIDYGKGCFLGQEPIVRIRDRGHINWRLARLRLDGDGAVLPEPGDRLESDLKPKAGRVTSAARLPDGRGVALGLVHVSVPAGSAVRVLHGDAALKATVVA